MPWLLALVNTIGGAGSAASAVAAVVRPPLLAPRDGTNRDDRFYPAMYAARSVPLGLMVAVVVWLAPVTLVVVAGRSLAAGPAVVGMMSCPCLSNDPGGVVTGRREANW